MSHRNARASNARLLKAVAAETEQAPAWIQAGKKVYSPRHGTGIITIFIKGDIQCRQFSMLQWARTASAILAALLAKLLM